MITFIALQSTYHDIEVGLFVSTSMIECIQVPKLHASATLIPSLRDLLARHNLSLKDLSFMVANQGPGPFTTLRVVIATVNAVCFATHIPLVGVDGLQAFLLEHANAYYPYTIALLNAFNQDVYVGIYEAAPKNLTTSCKNIDTFLQECASMVADHTVRFLGNGVALYAQKIHDTFGSQAFIPSPLPETCSLYAVGLRGLEQWQTQVRGLAQLSPLYLK